MTFEEIVKGLDVYVPNGDGTYDHPFPCRTCGSQAWLLDPEPVCLVCDRNIDAADMAMRRLCLALDTLQEVAGKLPEADKARLRLDLDWIDLAVAKIRLAVR